MRENKTCPVCKNEVKEPKSYANYFNCPECNEPLAVAEDFINFSTNTYITFKEIKFVEWLIENNHIKEGDLIEAYKPTRSKFSHLAKKFKEQSLWDVVITNKSGKKYLCNEGVTYQQAKEICNREDTSFQNSFAGFVISGTYKNMQEGEPFEL